MRSLRRSVIRGILFWAMLTLVIGFVLLLSVFQVFAVRRFDQNLASLHRQVVVALADTRGDPNLMQNYLTFPEYQNALSGLYWQVQRSDGELVTSPSTAFGQLAVPPDVGSELQTYVGDGPDEGEVRGIHQQVLLEDGSSWTVSVAQSVAILARDREEVGARFLVALIATGAIGMFGVGIQISLAPMLIAWFTACGLIPPEALFSARPENIFTSVGTSFSSIAQCETPR